LQSRKTVFVVDDDPGTLKGVKRLLRQYGYDSLAFPSAEAFQNHDDFEKALCVILDINLNDESGIDVRHPSQGRGNFRAGHLHHRERQPPPYRMAAMESGCHRLSHKAVLSQVSDRADEKASAGAGRVRRRSTLASFVDGSFKGLRRAALPNRGELV